MKIGDSFSDETFLSIGVPQGSVLGGVLFLIYMNDLPSVSNKLTTTLYADDTCFTVSGNSYEQTVDILNVELCKISKWLNLNRLSLNISKTVAVNFSKRKIANDNVPKIKLNGVTIELSSEVKYYGIVQDSNLTFRKHIDLTLSKISKSTGIIYRVSHNAPKCVLKSMYYAIVYPYLLYCNLIWGAACESNLNKLLIAQKRIVRIIGGKKNHEHSNPLFYELGILKINDVHKLVCCEYAFKNSNLLTLRENYHNTRLCETFRVRFQRLNVSQRSLQYIVPRMYNDLPESLRGIGTISSFKRELKKTLLNGYM